MLEGGSNTLNYLLKKGDILNYGCKIGKSWELCK